MARPNPRGKKARARAQHLRNRVLNQGINDLFNAPYWTAGNRALNMAAYTENYLSPNVKGWFGKNSGPVSSAFKTSAGKYVAEAFGWNFEAGTGKAGVSGRYMGASSGFLGSKYIAKHGLGGAAKMGEFWGQALGGAMSLGYTLYAMGVGYQEDGLAGAAMGLGESVVSAAIFRKAFMPAMGTVWSGANVGGKAYFGMKSGYAAGVAATRTRAMGFMLGRGIQGSTAIGMGVTAAGAGVGAVGAIGAGIAAGVLGAVTSPLFWLTTGAMYAGGKAMDYIDHNNRAIGRQKQIRAMEMGSPIADQFGTISTLRQRSLAAIQNSHVNGRMALGNEAALLH